jgi:hypothetical protein
VRDPANIICTESFSYGLHLVLRRMIGAKRRRCIPRLKLLTGRQDVLVKCCTGDVKRADRPFSALTLH